MRVGFDASLLSRGFSGVHRALRAQVLALADRSDIEPRFYMPRREAERLLPGRMDLARRTSPMLWAKPLRVLWQHFVLPIRLYRDKADILHAPAYFAPVIGRRIPVVVSVYDVIPLRHPELCPIRTVRHFAAMMPRTLERATRVLVPTEAVRREVVEGFRFPARKVLVVPLGVDARFRPVPEEDLAEIRARYRLKRPFLLFAGVQEPKKNLERLLKAFFAAKLERDLPHEIAIAGASGPSSRTIRRLIRGLAMRPMVRFLGRVPDADLPALFSAADGLAQPSLAEGFGLPPLEAMACGTPVLASRIPAFEETLGSDAILVPPEHVPSIRQGILDLLLDETRRREMRSRGQARAARYTWERCAEDAVRAYREALG